MLSKAERKIVRDACIAYPKGHGYEYTTTNQTTVQIERDGVCGIA